ncbi:protein FAM72 [Mycotypha africana]|uniref:protein FAM72 n=1 Tax=Mycotypha africana TaxID=64632 RepID=UPI0023011688|nr:protein FAM72 [Mycotypha africana]KAI8973478.1 protein FAM72 [Mycotypha africana]
MRLVTPRPIAQQTNNSNNEALLSPSKPVYQLTCRHCLTMVCTRGMKAILLADTSIELYSTDAPAQSIHILDKDYLTRSCHCRIRDVACLQCGNVIGYHVISPCIQCLDASNNGHFWMFHSNACQPTERQDKDKRILVWSKLPRAEMDQDFIRGNKHSYEQLCR